MAGEAGTGPWRGPGAWEATATGSGTVAAFGTAADGSGAAAGFSPGAEKVISTCPTLTVSPGVTRISKTMPV